MTIYKNRLIAFQLQQNITKKKVNTISFARLFVGFGIVFLIYKTTAYQSSIFAICVFLLFLFFFYLVKIHSKTNNEKKYLDALISINRNEIDFLENQKNVFENGSEFIDVQHFYTFDLDVFGTNSVFQHFNRTKTFVGKQRLAELFSNILQKNDILEQQKSVNELADKLDFRQDFTANAINADDSEKTYKRLMLWTTAKTASISKPIVIWSFLSPMFFLGLLVAYYFTENNTLLSYLSTIFIINMSILGLYYKKIAIEIQYISEMVTTIKNYSIIIQNIENQNFESKKLKDLKAILFSEKSKASADLEKLSKIFGNMDTINNLVTTLLFNGTFLFHLHILNQLSNWKKNHVAQLKNWLDVISEFETVISLSNFSYNNPSFVFPELNNDFEISFENLVHPLLQKKVPVGNSINFSNQSFFILTGSNMSGKSTFLRSLGLNMVLAGIGSVVCATKATLQPMPILVAMRSSDSIAENESYFYAEIKRLKKIIDYIENQKCFVLLDEILRGTNSDDKQSGTIAVIEKMISKSTIGVIATHDIEVCLTTNKYPKILENKCFEAQIIKNDLHFDYQLRDGICKNKSATFLMKKLDII